jgi:myo-inositol-1(or 4)-monophosphatase
MTGNPSAPPEEVIEPAALTELAIGLARRAAELMLARRAQGFSISTKSSATDVVTDADHAVEEFLRAELVRLRPGDSILGEEAGDQGPAAASVRWLLDPIDGTVNFMLGLPQYAVSIAAEIDGRTVAGCVLNPVSGDLFSATLAGGAYLDSAVFGRRRLTGPRSVPLAEAIVATGFGYDAELRATQGRLAGELLGRVGNLRRLGSAALDLCALAAGWVDLYYEGPLGEWDFAAGLLIAQEAGAVTGGLAGAAAGTKLVAAGHQDVAEEFFGLLDELSAGTGLWS